MTYFEEITTSPKGEVSTLNATSTPLGIGATYAGSWEDVTNYDYLEITVYTDVNSAINGALLYLSMDGGTTGHKIIPQTITGGVGALSFVVPVTSFNAFKVVYINGGTAQAAFMVRVEKRAGANAIPLAPLGAVLNPTLSGAVVRLSSDTYSASGGTITSSGDNSIITPSTGKALRIYYVLLNADGSNSTDVTAIVKFASGGSTIFKLSLKAGAIYARNIGAGRRYLDGAVGEALIINLSTAVNGLHWSVEYEEV